MSRRRLDPLDCHLAAWSHGELPELDRALPAMPAELREVLLLHYRGAGPLKCRRMSYPGSPALYWQRWGAARAWVGGFLAARATHGEAAGDAQARPATSQSAEG